MRTFVREKKIYCGRDFLEVDIYNYTATEQEVAARGRRSKKQVESTQKQIDWNDINAKRRFIQLVNTNFTANDIHVSLTYSNANLPPTFEAAELELRNFLRRVDYHRKKKELSPLKYIIIPVCVYKKDGVTPARIHHHVIMNGGLSRDEIENLWRKRRKKGQKKGDKIGYANADRLQPEENGFVALCEYLSKQTGGKKRWIPSKNLDKPEKEITDPDSPPKTVESKFSTSANLHKLGLQDVLLDVKNNTVYTPNTNQCVKIGTQVLQSAGESDIIDDTAEEKRFNPNHDPSNGKFSSGGFSGLKAKMSKKEWTRVSSQIFSDFPTLKADGKIRPYENRNHFYIFSVNSPGRYSFHFKMKLEGNQEKINAIREAIRNE